MTRGALGRRFCVGLLAGVVAFLGVVTSAIGQAADHLSSRKSVLILYAESRVLPAMLRVDEAIRARFQTAGVEAEFATEHLDLSWASGPGYAALLRPFFLTKHLGRRFDVVIVVGAEALQFALDSRAGLFPGVPIVFCLVTPPETHDIRLADGVTGIWMVADAADTLVAAHRLQPRARRVVIVAGASTPDGVFLESVKRDLTARPVGLKVSYLVGPSLEEMRTQLSKLPDDTIVLFTTFLRDGAGRTFSGSGAIASIAPVSRAPVYGLWDTMMGRGIVGGRLIAIDAHSTMAADMAIRILRGEPVPPVATPGTPANVYMFDWRELRRWGLSERDLPAGSIVLNRIPSVWEAYRWHIVGAVGLIGAQGLLISALLLQHRSRHRVEMVLRERLGFETLVSDLTATFVDLRGTEVHDGIEQGLRRVGEHLGIDRALLLEFTAEAQAIHLTHAWTAPGVPGPPSVMDRDRFPWWVEQLVGGEVVRFSTLEQLPEAAAVDRESFATLGITSKVGIPLAAAGTTIGVLALSTLRRTQEWPDDLVQRLEFVGGIFSSALLRQRWEVELRKLRRDLTHVGRVSTMGELTASIAHELNQPLTAILTNAQAAERLIDSGVDAKAVREIVSDIVADDKRAGDVIRRLRAFVKKDDTKQAPLDINAVVQDVVSLVRSDAIIRGVSIDVDLDPSLPVVLADRVQLQQVVLNLIMNGLDAMRSSADRRLAIATWTGADDAVRVAVSDRGSGIAESDLSRIFEPFYTTKPQGLGMGLSIARSLVEAHGGRLWAKNNSNGGATFTFTLPLVRERVA